MAVLDHLIGHLANDSLRGIMIRQAGDWRVAGQFTAGIALDRCVQGSSQHWPGTKAVKPPLTAARQEPTAGVRVHRVKSEYRKERWKETRDSDLH